ncbi:MAG: ABC transporter substrate-binding protein [Candidatus Limnocylindrales bacterium]
MSHRTRTGFAFGAAAALAITAIAPVAAQDETALIYAIDGEISALNNGADDVPTDEANTWLHNALYTLDESLTPTPDIAAEPATISEDGLTWTIKLREDVYFQPTGEQLTAEDVVFTYELANSDNCTFNPDACLAFVTVTPEGAEEPVKVLQSVTAVDDFTVEFQLADKYAPFTTVSLPSLWIDSKTATEEAFARFQENLGAVTAADVDALIAAADSETFVADAEATLASAQFAIPDPALHQNEDGSLNEESYASALLTELTSLSTILNASEIDQIAAAYKLIDTARMPVGTGLFYVTEFRPGQDITAMRNETYHWGPSSFETLYMPIIKDDVAASAALAGGDIDWKYSLTADGYEQLRDNAGVKFAKYPDFGYFNLQFNLREGRLFADKNVRQALAYCIDKEATVEAATDGQGVPIYADIPPASWAYNPDVKRYPLDVDQAISLLEEAGYTEVADDGVRMTADGDRLETHILLRAGKPDRSKFMQLLASQAKDCGFNLTLEEADFGTVLLPGLEWPLIMAGQSEQWDAYFGGWGTSYDPDPYSLYHSNNIVTEDLPDTYNYIGFSNERADELIEAGLRELDQAKRAEIYQEFEAIMAEELPALWAWSDEERQGLNATLTGEIEWDESVMSTPTWFWELEKINKGGATVLE